VSIYGRLSSPAGCHDAHDASVPSSDTKAGHVQASGRENPKRRHRRIAVELDPKRGGIRVSGCWGKWFRKGKSHAH
jgi:hypothetical protein